jgi:hypothetical protein
LCRKEEYTLVFLLVVFEKKTMFKRFDKYVARAQDDNCNDELLQEEIYVPEVTRNGMRVEELEDLGNQKDEAGAMYTCSICPGKSMKSMSEVSRHIESKDHKKRELMPDPEVLATKRQREQDEKLAAVTNGIDHPHRKVSRRKKLKTKLEKQLQKLNK